MNKPHCRWIGTSRIAAMMCGALALLLLSPMSQGMISVAAAAEPEVCAQPPATGTSWTVTISRVTKKQASDQPAPAAAGGAAEAEDAKLDLPTQLAVQTGRNGVSQGKITFKSGRTESFYGVNGRILVPASNSAKILTFPQDTLNPHSLRCTSFPGTAWITKKLERRAELRGSVPCLYYYYDEFIDNKPSIRIEAWIRQADRYPCEVLVDGDTLYKYSELVPFTEDIVLPPAYQSAVTKLQAKNAAMQQIQKANARQAK